MINFPSFVMILVVASLVSTCSGDNGNSTYSSQQQQIMFHR